MRKLKYTFKTDTLFKMLFVRNPELLKMLISALLRIPPEEIEEFRILNLEMSPDNLGDKFCRLDIHMVVNSQRVDLEIQVDIESDYRERTMLYWARSYSTSLAAGQPYYLLPRTVIISIVNFKMFDWEDYHSFFQLLEVKHLVPLSDKIGLHFFELPKLPSELDKNDMLLLWLSLFKANTEEDLEKIKALEVPVMNKMISEYYTVTSSSEFHEIERLREKARHDEAQILYQTAQKNRQEGIQVGRQEGIQVGRQEGKLEEKFEVAKKLKEIGVPLDQIIRATNLTGAEVEHL